MTARPAEPVALPVDAQIKLMGLYGALQGVEWAVVEALATIAGPAPLGCPALHEQLLKLQLGLVKYQGVCLNHIQLGGSP